MQNINMTTKLLGATALLIAAPFVSNPLNATPLAIWDSTWTQFADDDGMSEGPGVGGQAFDTEYLYYSLSGTTLSIGLQTGFDVVDGHLKYGGVDYYAGDLALSFDGTSDYEFGADFGFLTRNYSQTLVDTGSGTGIDTAGIYNNAVWDNGVYSGHTISNPFALDGGTLISGAGFTQSSGVDGSSFYHIVNFDLASLGVDLFNPIDMDVHWTMSCGNDNINGNASFSAPEPGILALLATGLIGMAVATSRKRKNTI